MNVVFIFLHKPQCFRSVWNNNKWLYCSLQYYQAKGLSEEEIRHQVGDCSRHRAKYVPPQTPEHFWSVDFPDTVECEKRGIHSFSDNFFLFCFFLNRI